MTCSCSFEAHNRSALFLLSPRHDCKDAAVKVWPTSAQAVWFLLWVCRIFVYRAFVRWVRAIGRLLQFMFPDELLWRIAVHWPDLGNSWHHVGWRLIPVDDSRSASCLSNLVHPTYVLGLLSDPAHRPHGLLEVTQSDMCHVRASAATEN